MIAPLDRIAEREPSPVGQLLPSGHLSLLDMINFSLREFINTVDLLDAVIAELQDPESIDDIEAGKYSRRVTYLLQTIAGISNMCNLVRTRDRIGHLSRFISISSRSWKAREIEIQLQVLREAIVDDIKMESFFHYSMPNVLVYTNRDEEWSMTIRKFKSTKREIDAATDCYALGYNTASVFHLMRIAEYGLRSLSYCLGIAFPKDGKPIEWADWQNLIEQIRSKGEAHANSLPIGPVRDEARDFYSGASSHFSGFKDQYRNSVMHVRADYDKYQAMSAMVHVRDFMNSLSRKIDEDSKNPIQWML